MKTPIFALAGPTGAPSNSAARYLFVSGHANGSWASSPGVPCPLPIDCVISDLYVRFPTAITSGTWDVYVQKGVGSGAPADTAITAQVSSSAAVARDGTNRVSFSAGDSIIFRANPTGTPTAQSNPVQIACVLEGVNKGEGAIFAAHQGSATGGYYVHFGANNDTSGTETARNIVMPTDGIISSLYVRLTAAPGVGNSRTYVVRKNGADTALTVTISGTNTTGSVTADVSFAAGDLACISVAVSGTPASSNGGFGLGWKPTVDGESLLCGTFTSAISTSLTRYGNPNGQTLGGISTEGDVTNIAPIPFALRKLYARLETAPGGTTYRNFTVRRAVAGSLTSFSSTALTTQVLGASTSNVDSTNAVSVGLGDVFNIETVPSASAPAVTNTSRVSAVAFVSPGGRLTTLGAG